MSEKRMLTQVEQALDYLIGISDTFNRFDLYDDGKLVIAAAYEDHIVMQFDNRQGAKDWLVENFEKFKDSERVEQIH